MAGASCTGPVMPGGAAGRPVDRPVAGTEPAAGGRQVDALDLGLARGALAVLWPLWPPAGPLLVVGGVLVLFAALPGRRPKRIRGR